VADQIALPGVDPPTGRRDHDEFDGRWLPDNRVSTKHGGEGALQRLGRGQELVGMGAEVEIEVRAEYEARGAVALMVDETIRLATVSRLFHRAVLAAAESGDLKMLERYAHRGGWLGGVVVRALKDLIEVQDKENRGDYAAVIQQIEEDAHA